ncbi:MAG: A24 family peptidase [Rhizobiaceae bacterium]|nr:A24 family peptidase [Rhizobiaceae bacterium]
MLILQVAVIACIDFRRFVIPDTCNAALAASGICVSVLAGRFDAIALVVSIGLFGGLFAAIRQIHAKMSGRIGLGMGDVKMAAAAGCWISGSELPFFLGISSLAGLGYVTARLIAERRAPERIPFGPFLGFGLVILYFVDASQVQANFFR